MVWKPGQSGHPGGQFRPGVSGNPAGRPKSRPYKESLDRILKAIGQGDQQQALDQLNAAMYAKAMNGDVAAYKEIADRYEGKVPTPVGGTDELPAIKAIAWLDTIAAPLEVTSETDSANAHPEGGEAQSTGDRSDAQPALPPPEPTQTNES